ncbi:hypothetical protein VKS41_004883 [Umbelopsis sp. WA50703]
MSVQAITTVAEPLLEGKFRWMELSHTGAYLEALYVLFDIAREELWMEDKYLHSVFYAKNVNRSSMVRLHSQKRPAVRSTYKIYGGLIKQGNSSVTIETQLYETIGNSQPQLLASGIATIVVIARDPHVRTVKIPQDVHLPVLQDPSLYSYTQQSIPSSLPDEAVVCTTQCVRPSDCGKTGHISNTKYAALFVDAFKANFKPVQTVESIVGLDILFEQEVFAPEEIAVWGWQENDNQYVFVLTRQDGSVGSKARITVQMEPVKPRL